MSDPTPTPAADEVLQIELKNPHLAALLAWLWPGAGHLYQGRYAKGVLFMVCVLGTFFFGLTLGGGHVVYASWNENHKNLPYLAQLGVGLPAMPALVQNYLISRGHGPLLGSQLMLPPQARQGRDGHWRWQAINWNGRDQLADWHHRYGFFFDLGMYYTVIAGLLNVLAIYDAFAGPVYLMPEDETDKPPDDTGRDKEPAKAKEQASDKEQAGTKEQPQDQVPTKDSV